MRRRVVVISIIVVGVVASAALFWNAPPPEDPLAWALEFELACPLATDLAFSPDGRWLAIAEWEYYQSEKARTLVYDLAQRRYVLESEPGGWNCAWSSDGATLAVASMLTPEIRVLESQSWKCIRTYEIPWKEKTKRDLLLNKVGSLCLDRSGNAYAKIDDIVTHDEGKWDPALVWWKVPRDPSRKYEPVGMCVKAAVLSVSASNGDGEPRVAVSYWNPTHCPIEILRLRRDARGQQSFALEYTVPCAEMAQVVLTPDGRYLAVCDLSGLRLYRLLEDRAELVASLVEEIPQEGDAGGVFIWRRTVEFSRDGRFVVGDSRGGIEVFRVADGASVFRVDRDKFVLTQALSPDGKLLAVAFQSRKRICVYRIPQGDGESVERAEKTERAK